MASRECAADIKQHLVEHDWHGYTQGWGRWGDGEGACEVNTCDGIKYVAQGDRDCSSSDIDSYRTAGLPVGSATYTGNMHECFMATGCYRWHPTSDGSNCDDGYIAQRGDLYLNHRDHVAMCSSAVPDMMYEFYIAENGTIFGDTGDQLQQWGLAGESRESPYKGFPWDGVIEYIGGASKGDEARPIQIWPSNGTDAQRWQPQHHEDGSVTLINVACGKALDVMGAGTASGTPCQVYPVNGTPAQDWFVVQKSGDYAPEFNRPVAIVPKVNQSLRLDVRGGGDVQGTGIHVYELNDTPAQQWYVMDSGDGMWTLLNNSQGAKLALDVVNAGA